MSRSFSSAISRRSLLAAAGATAFAVASKATPAVASSDFPANAVLPPDLGQAEIHVWVPETGHTLRGSMLDYWRATGGAAVYGNPITEPFATEDGLYSQAFDTAIFQYRPEYAYTDQPMIRLMPIGQMALDGAITTAEADLLAWNIARRLRAGSEPLDPESKVVRRAVKDGAIYVEATGHLIEGMFRSWYAHHEGQHYLGLPLTERVQDGAGAIQYFEGGVLRRRDGESPRLVPVGRTIAKRLGLDTTPLPRNSLRRYNEKYFQSAQNPYPEGDPDTAGRRWIKVSIGKQELVAYQDRIVVLRTPISSGLTPNDTSKGVFHVYQKHAKQTMKGFTSTSGEVIGVGGEAPAGAAAFYEVEDVPNVLYFSPLAEALHGAYWHNNFGQPMSHGCINLPVDVAKWMYGWAPLGTQVIVED